MGNKQAKKDCDEEVVRDHHQVSIPDICSLLETDAEKGLSDERAKELLKENGPNKVTINKDPKKIGHDKQLGPETAVVIRDGETKTIPAEELVVGDLVEVKAGEEVPADLRVVSSDGCRVDKSMVTGDSEPQTLQTELTDPNPMETANLAFLTSKVVEGSARGIVVLTGDKTIMGQIAPLTSFL